MQNLWSYLLAWIIIGLVAGWLMFELIPYRGFGLIGDITVGIHGAVLGGWLFALLGVDESNLGSLITSFLGAVVLLALVALVRRPDFDLGNDTPIPASFRARHKCKKIAELRPLAEGRTVWIGELLERDPIHPIETHCLHIITPENDVVFGVYSGDAGFIGIIAQILHGGPINPEWVNSMESYSRRNAEREATG